MRTHSTTSAASFFRLAVFGLLPMILVVSACFGEEAGKVNLPLKKVVLFNSGVGFFQHEGQVDGNAQADLQFKVDQINDLLMSLVVQDLDGGQISAVGYGSKDPIAKTLKTFAIDLTTNPTLGQLLQQVRGERIELEAPNKLSGMILGVEYKTRKTEHNDILTVEILNLLTDEGLGSVPLESVSRIRLVNPKLDAELRKALSLLASAHATDKKAVSFQFLGDGKRRVRIGYIQEAPVWKTSYRLVLSDKKPPFLQGWAIVENTTDRDWTDVDLTLVSGRPISFIMNLYDPLYLPRPVAALDLYRSLQPRTYGQDLEREQAAAKPSESANEMMVGFARGPIVGRMQVAAGVVGDAKLDQYARGGVGYGAARERRNLDEFNLRQGVQAAAEAGDVGELFQYAIAHPVSMERQKSAMLPIVNAEIQGEKVSIYNPAVLAKHPLCGLQLTNSTKLHLMQGPITVFDGGVYAGDAQIEDLAPGGKRLVSYAVDLDTEVAMARKGRPEQLLSVQLRKGTMIATHKLSRTVEYTVKNSGGEPRTVLIEQPLDANWKLIAPKKPTEKTRDRYRFTVEAKLRKPAKLAVEEERTTSQRIALTNMDDNAIVIYLRADVVSEQVKAALQEIVKQKNDLSQLTARRQQLEGQLNTITEEQSRIRQNMDRLDRTSDLYKRYVGKLNEQENTVETVRGQVQQLISQEVELRKALDAYLLGLDIE